MITPEQFFKNHLNEEIPSSLYPLHLVKEYLSHYAIIKQIEENKSMLEMAKVHLNERAVFVIKDRISQLESELEYIVKKS